MKSFWMEVGSSVLSLFHPQTPIGGVVSSADAPVVLSYGGVVLPSVATSDVGGVVLSADALVV